MKNKHLILLLAATLGIFACQKDASLSDLDGKYTVYTNYDKSADFATLSSYYIPDSILIINSNDSEAEYWTSENALELVNTFVTNMDNRGFTRVTDKSTADLGIQLSFAEVANYYVDSPYWWSDYPYYWPTDYWGNWYGWYYPYSIVYSYTSGTLLAEAVDLKAAQGTDKTLPVVWSVFMGGVLGDSESANLNKLVIAINQAFTQSPYIKVATH